MEGFSSVNLWGFLFGELDPIWGTQLTLRAATITVTIHMFLTL